MLYEDFMRSNQRTVLMALFGPGFLISEDYQGDNLLWKQFRRAVRLEIEFRKSHPNNWGFKPHKENAVSVVGDKRKVVPFRSGTPSGS